MPTFEVEVDVALRRPPRCDATRYYRLEAATGSAAELLACQWAALRSVMPVASRVVDWDDDPPVPAQGTAGGR